MWMRIVMEKTIRLIKVTDTDDDKFCNSYDGNCTDNFSDNGNDCDNRHSENDSNSYDSERNDSHSISGDFVSYSTNSNGKYDFVPNDGRMKVILMMMKPINNDDDDDVIGMILIILIILIVLILVLMTLVKQR